MTRIIEGGGSVSAPKNGTIPVRIIVEGEGSSGIYSADVLKKSAQAFESKPMFVGHPDDPNRPDQRKITDAVAKTGKVTVGETSDGRTALFTEATPRSDYANFLEEFSDVFGVSIYASVVGDTNDDGKVVVESFDGTDPYVSVDFVVAPGREGRFGKRAMESLAAIQTSTTTVAEQTSTSTEGADNKPTEESLLDIKELGEKVDSLVSAVEALTTLVNPIAESLKPAEKGDVEVDIEGAVEAAVEAKLPKSFRKAVVEAVKAGTDIKEAVKAQEAAVASIKEELGFVEGAAPQAGFVTESKSISADEYKIGAWS